MYFMVLGLQKMSKNRYILVIFSCFFATLIFVVFSSILGGPRGLQNRAFPGRDAFSKKKVPKKRVDMEQKGLPGCCFVGGTGHPENLRLPHFGNFSDLRSLAAHFGVFWSFFRLFLGPFSAPFRCICERLHFFYIVCFLCCFCCSLGLHAPGAMTFILFEFGSPLWRPRFNFHRFFDAQSETETLSIF